MSAEELQAEGEEDLAAFMARTYGISPTEFASGHTAPPQPVTAAQHAEPDEDMRGSSDDDVDPPAELAGGVGGAMHGGASSSRAMFDMGAGASTSQAIHDGAGPSWRTSALASGASAAGPAGDSSWALDLLHGADDDADAAGAGGGGGGGSRRSRAAAATAAAATAAGPSTSAGVAGSSRAAMMHDGEDDDEDDELEGERSEEEWMHGEAVDDEATLEEEERLAGADGYAVRSLLLHIHNTHTVAVFFYFWYPSVVFEGQSSSTTR